MAILHPLEEPRAEVRLNAQAVACALNSGMLWLKVREEFEDDVASAIDVSIQNNLTLRALENLVATKLLVNVTAGATSLGGIRLVNDYYNSRLLATSNEVRQTISAVLLKPFLN